MEVRRRITTMFRKRNLPYNVGLLCEESSRCIMPLYRQDNRAIKFAMWISSNDKNIHDRLLKFSRVHCIYIYFLGISHRRNLRPRSKKKREERRKRRKKKSIQPRFFCCIYKRGEGDKVAALSTKSSVLFSLVAGAWRTERVYQGPLAIYRN